MASAMQYLPFTHPHVQGAAYAHEMSHFKRFCFVSDATMVVAASRSLVDGESGKGPRCGHCCYPLHLVCCSATYKLAAASLGLANALHGTCVCSIYSSISFSASKIANVFLRAWCRHWAILSHSSFRAYVLPEHNTCMLLQWSAFMLEAGFPLGRNFHAWQHEGMCCATQCTTAYCTLPKGLLCRSGGV